MNAIEIENLCRDFGEKQVVKNLSLTVKEGEFFSLLGVNGAGKTTTIRMLCGLLRPTAGCARVAGFDVDRETAEVKARIGLSPQETAVAGNLTVRENLSLIAELYGKGRAEAQAAADEMIARFSLSEVQNTRAVVLSGGWKRRLSLAMALIPAPAVVFLDEPTLGLDVLARRELWRLLEQLKGKMTVILTTHYLEEAELHADRIGVMAGGKLTAVGTARELCGLAGCEKFEDAFITLCERGCEA